MKRARSLGAAWTGPLRGHHSSTRGDVLSSQRPGKLSAQEVFLGTAASTSLKRRVVTPFCCNLGGKTSVQTLSTTDRGSGDKEERLDPASVGVMAGRTSIAMAAGPMGCQ